MGTLRMGSPPAVPAARDPTRGFVLASSSKVVTIQGSHYCRPEGELR